MSFFDVSVLVLAIFPEPFTILFLVKRVFCLVGFLKIILNQCPVKNSNWFFFLA